MTTAAMPGEDDALQAIRLIDRRLGAAPNSRALLALRERLAGELVGDAPRVAATLGPDFTLVTHAGGTRATSREALLAGIRGQGATGGGALLWLRLEDLVVDGDTIAGQGSLQTLLTASVAATRGWRDLAGTDLHLTSVPIAFLIRFDGGLMASEVLYMDSASSGSWVLQDSTMPEEQRLLGLIGREQDLSDGEGGP